MNLKSYFLYAMRLLFPKTEKKSNARRSLIGATLCIGLSIVPMVVVLTVANGMIDGITERIITLSSSHIRCYLYENGGVYDHAQKNERAFKNLSEKIKQVEGVKDAYCEIKGIGLAAGLNGRTGATVRAVDEKIFSDGSTFKSLFTMVEGQWLAPDEKSATDEKVAAEPNEETAASAPDEKSVAKTTPSEKSAPSALIGQKLADTLKLKPNDTFRLITTRKLPNGKILPKITNIRVSGIISSGYQELDALWVFLPLSSGFSIFGNSATFEIGIEVENPYGYKLKITEGDIRKILSNADNGAGRYATQTWSDANAGKFENFSSTKLMLVLIMILIVLVASVNIASALVMLVIERRKEIAILKSVGAKPRGIEFSFLTAGFFTGLFGVSFGVPVGLLLSYNFSRIVSGIEKLLNFFARLKNPSAAISLLNPEYYLQNIKITLPVTQLLLIIIGTLLLSILVSLMPSRKAGREKPTLSLSS